LLCKIAVGVIYIKEKLSPGMAPDEELHAGVLCSMNGNFQKGKKIKGIGNRPHIFSLIFHKERKQHFEIAR
jgi:hypothetical protein